MIVTKKLLFSFVLIFFAQASWAELTDVGYRVDPSRIDDPDFYLSTTNTGANIRGIYEQFSQLRAAPLDRLPPDFEPIVEIIYQHIQSRSEQKNVKSQFYVGENGEQNGEEFNFSRENLPTKIAKLSFCFGFDPLVFTGLLSQESHFSRKARSQTGAFGFTQLTGAAIAEVSEQLGLLGERYHGKGAPEIFNQYVQCYLGPQKEWSNMWEEGVIPPGKAAYVGNKVGSGRQWKFVTQSKKWLDQDPDRNLIYGAILFKLYLGHFGSYPKALDQYNVSHRGTYVRRVSNFYRNMQAASQVSLQGVEYTVIKIVMGNSECLLEPPEWGEFSQLSQVLEGLYPEDQLEQMFEAKWLKKGFCKPRQIHL
ncbi:MAG: hypothetical protein KDD38_05670 [Bdellovibrionales bacterium]|nr:hypothetical protein [Bdellovibrionales bacterium]